ncbi:MAG: GntR family transcriptional regulator [Bacillota bacterium]|nr:GntR family transcriptional regulator [Bacillota bacterium]
MFQIDLKSRKAIYEQVVDNFKEMIITGVLKPDEKVPSVRDMAKELTINPNTIQKAYRELENRGYFYSVSGLGSFVAAPADVQNNKARIDELKGVLKTTLNELVFLECPKEEIMEAIRETALTRKGGTDL